MPQISVTGRVPATILENSRPGDWLAAFDVTGDVSRVTGIEVQNANGLYFNAFWNPITAVATLEPAAVLDFEAFAAAGAQPLLSFTLRFVFDDGSRQGLPAPIRIAVLDVDDTPPSALRFATGGSVTAGAIGATIGTLAVTDPDSAGPFLFSFAEEDAWKFEVVNNTLKLRDGISLGLDDTPSRPLFIEVSDGRQSAGFTLDLAVRDPGGFESLPPTQPPANSMGGFSLTGDAKDNAFGLSESRDLRAANRYEDIAVQLTLAAGGEVFIPAVQTVQLADGRLEFGADSTAGRAQALFGATQGRAADGRELGALVARAEAGEAWADIGGGLITPRLAALDNTALVTELYAATQGRAPSGAELALQSGRLASGLDRDQLAADIALAAATVGSTDPYWVFAPLGSGDWRGDAGGVHAGGPPASALAGAWLF